MPPEITGTLFSTFQYVNDADKFPPSHDLPDKPVQRLKWSIGVPFCQDFSQNLFSGQGPGIQHGRQYRVREGRPTGENGVFIGPERPKTVGYEAIQPYGNASCFRTKVHTLHEWSENRENFSRSGLHLPWRRRPLGDSPVSRRSPRPGRLLLPRFRPDLQLNGDSRHRLHAPSIMDIVALARRSTACPRAAG